MRNLKLTLAYDGADFSGWQVQPDRRTVQGTLAEAFARVTGEAALPQGSGRTDTGVHALAQVATVNSASTIPPGNLVQALNDVLPPTIRVLLAEEVPLMFHARGSAHAKTYRYRIMLSGICSPFLARYVYHHPWPLNEATMMAAASRVEGEHDFTSFAAVDPERAERIRLATSVGCSTTQTTEQPSPGREPCTNLRTLFSSHFARQGDELIYTVRGNGFLHHMVRNLVGTFLLVGKGKLAAEDIPRILGARDRSANPGPTAPASGLYLVSVEY
jgi:tRNA pseudouridine38-40 synthase